MRWADLDELSHVNNVVYLDYAFEARLAHVTAGELVDRPWRSFTVEFLRPMLLRREPLAVETVPDQDGEVLVQEIWPAGASAPFARVTSRTAEGDVTDPVTPDAGEAYALRVRHSDLDLDGAVSPVKLFEHAQEARIATVARVGSLERGASARFVVAQVDLSLGEPVLWRPEAYEARTVVTHVGTSSFTVVTSFDGGRAGHARAALVGFDLETQRSRRLGEEEREVLTAQLVTPGP